MFSLGVAISILFSIAQAASHPAPLNPDPRITPGTLCQKSDSDFTEFRYAERIPYCQRNVSSTQKRKIYSKYNIPPQCQSEYTIDHFYPLSLGGNNGANNLWPEHKAVKQSRPNLEYELYLSIKAGEISQASALTTLSNAKNHPNLEEIPKGEYCFAEIIFKSN